MDIVSDVVALSLSLFFLGLGLFITMRIFSIPDTTTDGSYTLGAAITVAMLVQNLSPALAALVSFVGGALAGFITGTIFTRLKINPLLAGILVMTALFSVNLWIMGKSNVPLFNVQTLFNENESRTLLIMALIALTTGGLLIYFLQTDLGLFFRASGDAEQMVRANGHNPLAIKRWGLALANGLTALSGYFVTQLQGFADINMGVGIVISGMGSVVIGESICNALGHPPIWVRIIFVFVGTLILRSIVTVVLALGIDPLWLKFITAAVVLTVVALPQVKKSKSY